MSKKKRQRMEESDNFLVIDQNELDVEWSNQPELYYKWARKLADARLKLDEAKAELELTTADLDGQIRSDPDKYELGDKVTETLIKNTILAQTEYTDAVSSLNAAKHEVNILEAGVQALEHRKRALEKLVDLLAMEWRSEPRVSSEKGRQAKRKLEQSARRSYRSED